MIVLYTRVSTLEQNPDRQLTNSKDYDYILTDYCSGSLPLYQRPKGSEVKKMIDNKSLTRLVIHDVTRIGRNTLDVLSIWSELTERGIVIECKNPNIRNINEFSEKLAKYGDKILSLTEEYCSNPKTQKSNEMDETFVNYAKTCFRYFEMKELEGDPDSYRNSESGSSRDEDVLFEPAPMRSFWGKGVTKKY